MGNIIVVIILIAIVILALSPTIKHFKGQGACCGGGSDCAGCPKKRLEGSVISKKRVYIEGMKCDNCAKKAAGAINALDGAAAKVNLRKKRADVSLSREIPDEDIIRAVEDAGFSVSKIERVIQ